MSVWVSSFASVLAVSLIALVGLAALSMGEERLRRVSSVLVGFAVGGLLGDAFLHLLPECFADRERTLPTSLCVLGGVLLFFLLEKLLRHSHGPLHRQQHPEAGALPRLAGMNLAGDALHNLVDGALIAASYLASPTLGLSTTLAVLLHEIPQELGDFGILVHSGLGVRRALLFNLASACTAFLGALLALVAGAWLHELVARVLVPVAAGGFVYIAAADLIPELHHDRRPRAVLEQTVLILLGIGLMALLRLLE